MNMHVYSTCWILEKIDMIEVFLTLKLSDDNKYILKHVFKL